MKAELSKMVYAIYQESIENGNITQEVAISEECDSVSELRKAIKEKGLGKNDYAVVYSYELWVEDRHLGTGRGLTDEEARKDLETDLNLGCAATIAMIKRNPEKYYW